MGFNPKWKDAYISGSLTSVCKLFQKEIEEGIHDLYKISVFVSISEHFHGYERDTFRSLEHMARYNIRYIIWNEFIIHLNING